jgi:hypothetical protein
MSTVTSIPSKRRTLAFVFMVTERRKCRDQWNARQEIMKL